MISFKIWFPWLFSIPNSPKPFTPKSIHEIKAHPSFIRSRCMKFHGHMWITVSVMVWKPFSITNAPWPWPFDPEINRAHPWLMGSKSMKIHDHRWITGSVMVRKPFLIINAPWLWPLDPKSIGGILDSWRASVWSFIGWLQISQL